MSKQYDAYIKKHVKNVLLAGTWMINNIPDIHYYVDDKAFITTLKYHDDSKYGYVEYDAYNNYFCGSAKTDEVKRAFNRAWLDHIHRNPHHWQHWILIHDDASEEVLEMPFVYALEMIADWWSFSFARGNFYEIFDWYDANKDDIKLHPVTRKFVENILDLIRMKLNEKTN